MEIRYGTCRNGMSQCKIFYLFQPYWDSLLAYMRPMSPIPMIPSSMFAFCHSMSDWSMLIIAAWERSCCHGAGMREIVFWGKAGRKISWTSSRLHEFYRPFFVFWSLINHLSHIKPKMPSASHQSPQNTHWTRTQSILQARKFETRHCHYPLPLLNAA